jgi:hypothetical protein
MRPLSPAERQAVLAANPEATDADLDRLQELAARRIYSSELDEEELRALDEELAEIQARLPRFEEAVASVDEPGLS